MKKLIETKESRYSKDYITVAESDHKIVGAIILIPYDKLDKLSIETDIKLINKIDGLHGKLLYIINSIKYIVFRECRRGNLYISNIATDEKARGLGVGKMLMMYAEQVAKNEDFEGISLLAKNETVTKFYEKLNYKKIFDRVLLGERVIKMNKVI
ncbi:GNAT family N-acetyltransferase [Clostridium sp. AL.422]|uniref:GNAT family N-acetyltransferase n=1 Tax=Clostridium TaxID=1485 RepID=UPI00293DDAB9|nr:MULTISPECIES: GNAT family N-acetyltransferase [unclassified Clostridium]MDV4151007.1 GNAT family N-acetyltransferase [Clostridium sp. AL.422]